ncbi:MAG TPA: hypothetical protein PK760_05460, partial [Flavobacteriales bacterium]|nr:hypothetical protein [Flavobacteriales bacterium]
MRLINVQLNFGSFRSILIVALAMFSTMGVAQVGPPVMHCASVGVNGDVTITWTAPPDPNGEFVSYEMWHATDQAGPFTLLTTIGVYGQVNYVSVGGGGNSGPQFYYMITNSTGVPPISVPSDTIATLFLQVFQSTPLGSANLSWNAPAISSTAAANFIVWMEHPIGTWTQIATVPNTTFDFQWVVDICEDSLTFRVSLADALGCISYSNRDGDVFQDVTAPSVPVIIAVTVDSITGLSNIIWGPSPEPDTQGYIIVWNGPGGGVVIDTVFGQFNTSYEWPLSDPVNGAEEFTIAAFDTCLSGIPPQPNISATGTVHRTMLADTDYDKCTSTVRVFWTNYIGWTAQNYQVLMQMDGGLWSVLTNVGGGSNEYFHATQPGHNYCYIIKAFEGPGLATSLSNKICTFTVYPPQPQFNYLSNVTVQGPNAILVQDTVDLTAQVSGYTLQRSMNGSAYSTVATFPGTAGPAINYVDVDVNTAYNGYLYRMQVVDSCGLSSITSNVGSNILLRVTPRLDGVNVLDWNGYIQWAGTVLGYNLYRSVDGGAMELIATLPADPWNYEDNVNSFIT